MTLFGPNILEKYAIDAIRANVEIPKGLEAAMVTNPQLKQTLMPTVLEAVRLSFEDPDTRMRVLTQAEIKRRVGVALETMRILYCEQQWTLHQCYAVLKLVLKKSLLLADRAEDVAVKGQRQGIYGSGAEQQEVEVDVDSPDLAKELGEKNENP